MGQSIGMAIVCVNAMAIMQREFLSIANAMAIDRVYAFWFLGLLGHLPKGSLIK